MKKQVLGIFAALFVFMVLLPLGASASDNVYAILYDDGTLVFQHGDTPETGRTVKETCPVDLTAGYGTYPNYAPWQGESVRVVSFADKISPTSTAYWFRECKNLERVDNIQNLDTANVTTMSYMFSECSGLTTLDLSSFDTANVTDMSSMFFCCSGLTALDVSSFDTAKVKNMRAMFYQCSGLTALDVSSFDTVNVTDMSSMFDLCRNLMALNVSFDTTNVTNMSHMFNACNKLTVLDISSFDTANVTGMYWMFHACSKLKTIYASDKFTTLSVEKADLGVFVDSPFLVGGNGTKYSERHTNTEYARIDTPDAPGYFTDKSAVYAITYAAPHNGNLSVVLSNPGAATLAVSYFDANGQFVSATVQSVQANAGTVTLPLSAGTGKACVMLFDGTYRPLCGQFEAEIS